LPRPNRAAGRAGFDFVNAVTEQAASVGTPDFLFWQCRQAVLLTVELWEELDGVLKTWSPRVTNPAKLPVTFDVEAGLNAFYHPQLGLRFFHNTTGTKTTFSGASTDVVAHECGHALLDSVRPQLFDIHQTEFAAFHESFGDCVAILVALADDDCRKALLTLTPDLSKPNFVEAVMEDLSDGVRRQLGATHPAALPRRAMNNFQFQLPTALPSSAPPAKMSGEAHAFSRIFTGCFYDLIRGLFTASAAKDEQALRAAAFTAGKLLIAAAKQASVTSRFFQAVGRAMVLADDTSNGGANRAVIGQAFAGHGILLGSSAALMPTVSLPGAPPSVEGRARTAVVDPLTTAELKRRLNAKPSAKLAFEAVSMGGQKVVRAVHQRTVALDDLGSALQGVVAVVPESALLGNSGGSAAVLGALPMADTTQDEVLGYVRTLLDSGRIAVGKGRSRNVLSAVATEVPSDSTATATHTIVAEGGKRVLHRLQFACGCAAHRGLFR